MTTEPKSILIEQTAIAIAAEFYEQCRMIGMPCAPYRNQRHYVKKNFEKFIPKAVEALIQQLGPGYPEDNKMLIYEALIERGAYLPEIKLDS